MTNLRTRSNIIQLQPVIQSSSSICPGLHVCIYSWPSSVATTFTDNELTIVTLASSYGGSERTGRHKLRRITHKTRCPAGALLEQCLCVRRDIATFSPAAFG